MAETIKEYVTNKIGNDYLNWQKGDKILFDCGTGHGKTTFVLNTLAPYAASIGKSVLYMCNRIPLINQVTKNVEQLGLKNVDIMTYQKMQEMLKNDKKINSYTYIVADEIHYILSDSAFNDFTDLIFFELAGATESIVLFMSATADEVFNQISEFTVNRGIGAIYRYYIKKDYSYVDEITLYEAYTWDKEANQPLDMTVHYINNILRKTKDEKIIVFATGNRIKDVFHKIYGKKAIYYCSENTDNEYIADIREELKYDEISYGFEQQILFTTIAIDNGIDFKDTTIKHIFTELSDTDTIIQCLGRKRSIDDDDTCNFYIREPSPQQIGGYISFESTILEQVRLMREDKQGFLEAYGGNKGRYFINKNPLLYDFFEEMNNGFKTKTILNLIKHTKVKLTLQQHKDFLKVGFFEVVMRAMGLYNEEEHNAINEYCIIVNNEITPVAVREARKAEKKKSDNENRDRTVESKIEKNIETYKAQTEDIKRLYDTFLKYNECRLTKDEIKEVKKCMKAFGFKSATPETINIFIDHVMPECNFRITNKNHRGGELRQTKDKKKPTTWIIFDTFIYNDWRGFMNGDYEEYYNRYFLDRYGIDYFPNIIYKELKNNLANHQPN